MPTVIVYWSPGRTDEQKADVVREMTDVLVKYGGAAKKDVLIIFQDILPGNAGRAGVVLGGAAVLASNDGASRSDHQVPSGEG